MRLFKEREIGGNESREREVPVVWVAKKASGLFV